jgi:DNA-binding transcriptional MerR regulator
VRLYTTLGLLDRPVIKGRTGYYGLRHLRQLVAIKRLQAEGKSLAEIQNRLLGISDEELEQIASLPDAYEVILDGTNLASRRQTKFWRAGVPLAVTVTASQPAETLPSIKSWKSMRLAEGVHLVIEEGVWLNARAIRAIQQAAKHMRARKD